MTKEIKLYSKTICGTCLFVKNQFNTKEIEFTEINMDVDLESREKIASMGYKDAPVMELDGKFYNPGEIMEFLEG